MRIKGVRVDNGLYSVLVDMIQDDVVLSYSVSHFYDVLTGKLEVRFQSFNIKQDIPDDIKAKLTSILKTISSEF